MIQTILTSSLAEQFDIEHIPSVVDGSKAQKWWAVITGLGRFVQRLLTRRVALVYIHVGGGKSVYRKAAFILLAKLLGRKILLHIHGGNTAHYYYEQNRLAQWYLRSVLRLGDRFLVVSEALQQALLQYVPELEFHVLPNAVSAPAIGSSARNDGPVRVVYLGHFLPFKGIYDLVDAIAHIRATAPEIKFLLCGLHEVEQVRARCEHRGVMPAVEHLGPIPFEERWAVLQQADVFVLPSYEEGLPVTLLEAMAVGLPIIATPVGGIPQVMQDGINGLFVQPGDVNGLAARTLQLAQDPALRRRMGEANRIRVAREFDAAAFVEKLVHHLHHLTETPVAEVSQLKEAVSQSPATRP